MIRLLSIEEVLSLHERLIVQSGGSNGLRDRGALESAVAQPSMTFGQQDLYPGIVEKAVAMAFSLIVNHPFQDGNKRIGHAAMEVMLMMNGYEIVADDDDQERLILGVAGGTIKRPEFLDWVSGHVQPLS